MDHKIIDKIMNQVKKKKSKKSNIIPLKQTKYKTKSQGWDQLGCKIKKSISRTWNQIETKITYNIMTNVCDMIVSYNQINNQICNQLSDAINDA